MVQSDKGTEFLNSTFQSMLKRHDIKFYTSENEDIKAAVVERFNRTMKTKMYRYFTARSTRHYVDVLPDLLYSYNHTYHRSIGSVLFFSRPRSEGWPHHRLTLGYIHFGPWSLRSSVTSVLGPKCTSISVFSQFGPRSFRSLGPK